MIKQSLHLVPLRRDHHQAKLVFVLFIASLTMFFLAGLTSYLIIRNQAFMPIQRTYRPLILPWTFWLSTAFLILTSVYLERANWFVRREQSRPFMRNLYYAFAASLIFVWIQTWGLVEMVEQHYSALDGSTKIYGISFALSFLHGLHVIGGMVFLGFVIFQARRLKYDHERHWAVGHCAGYWHFLDIVWVAMLATFALGG